MILRMFLFLLFLITGAFCLSPAQSGFVSLNTLDNQSALLNHKPDEQPESRNSTTSDRIVQFYSNALKGNFFSGKGGEYEFKASLFGIGKVFHDSSWMFDTEYLKRKFLRNFEVSVGLKFKDGQEVNGITPSLKYALVNKRDRTEENFSVDMASDLRVAVHDLRDAVNKFYAENSGNKPLVERVEKSMDKFTASQKLEDLDESFRKYLRTETIKSLSSKYDSIAKEVDKKPLWTLTMGGSFTKETRDSLFIKTEFYQGIANGKDLVLRGLFGLKDTSASSSRFDRTNWLLSAGLDLVLLRVENKSVIDGNVSIEYGSILSGLTSGEEKNHFNFAITVSPLVAVDLSLPLTLKYDPKDGKIFGFLELQWNLKPIKKGE